MMAKFACALTIVLAASAPAFAQGSEDFHKNNIMAGIGPAIPMGNSSSYLTTAPMLVVGYGYRFNKWFQADAGFQIAWGAANNQNGEVSDFGTVQGGDHEYMIPLGGRVYVPTRFDRIQASLGAGTAYLHYSETVSSNGYYQNNCYSCTSRGGWGGYGLADVSYFLDSNRNFRVGTELQYIVARTNGQPVGQIPGLQTTDHWLNVMFLFGLSF